MKYSGQTESDTSEVLGYHLLARIISTNQFLIFMKYNSPKLLQLNSLCEVAKVTTKSVIEF